MSEKVHFLRTDFGMSSHDLMGDFRSGAFPGLRDTPGRLENRQSRDFRQEGGGLGQNVPI